MRRVTVALVLACAVSLITGAADGDYCDVILEDDSNATEANKLEVGLGFGVTIQGTSIGGGLISFPVVQRKAEVTSFTCTGRAHGDLEGADCCPQCVGLSFTSGVLPVTIELTDDPGVWREHAISQVEVAAEISLEDPDPADTTCSVKLTATTTQLSATVDAALGGSIGVGPASISVSWSESKVVFGEQQVCAVSCEEGCRYHPDFAYYPASLMLYRGAAKTFSLRVSDSDGEETIESVVSDRTIDNMPIRVSYEPGQRIATVEVTAEHGAPIEGKLSFLVTDRCGKFGTADIDYRVVENPPGAKPTVRWVRMVALPHGGPTCDDRKYVITLEVANPWVAMAKIGVAVDPANGGISHGIGTHATGTWTWVEGNGGTAEVSFYYQPNVGIREDAMTVSLENFTTHETGGATFDIDVPLKLCAIDSQVHVRAGEAVDLPLGCTHPEAFADLAYHIETTSLPGIGTITGSAPHCTLLVHPTACADRVVIPYTIRSVSGAEARGRVTADIDHPFAIAPASMTLNRGSSGRVAVDLRACLDEIHYFAVDSREGVLVEEVGLIHENPQTHTLYQSLRITAPPETAPGTRTCPMRLAHVQGWSSESTLTVSVINARPSWHPTSLTSTFDAWVPAGNGPRPVYILDPDWEQMHCFTVADVDGDDLTIHVERSPRRGRAGVVPAGGGGAYEVHATYMPDEEALLEAHDRGVPIQDEFTLLARDEYGGWAEASVSVRIDVLNRFPVAQDDMALTDRNVPASISVLGNDVDGDNDTLSIASVGTASHGVVRLEGDVIRYVPGTDFVGSDSFSYSVSDGHGGRDSATVFVEVLYTDITPPTIVCPSDVSVATDPEGCEASASVGTAVATDEDGPTTVSATRSDGKDLEDQYPIGTTSIVWTAEDSSGNAACCTQQVIVADEQPPLIEGCRDIVLDAPAWRCQAQASWEEPVASDNCGVKSLIGTHSPGSWFSIGATTVTYRATDVHGNEAAETFDVIVRDVAPPAIDCPPDVTRYVSPERCDASPSVGIPMASDHCSAVTIGGARSDGQAIADPYPVGTTTIVWTAEDASGNAATCSQQVQVIDEQLPTIGNRTWGRSVSCDDGRCSAAVTWQAPTADDNCSIESFVSSHVPGDTFSVGTTTVTYTATDVNGNVTTHSFDVIVNDETPPLISGCPSDRTLPCSADGCAVEVEWTEPVAMDNCGVESFVSSHAPGDAFPIGTTTVTYVATDVQGNAALCEFDVIVVDTTPPEIAGIPDNRSISCEAGCAACVSWSEPFAWDNCDGLIAHTNRSHDPGSGFGLGKTTVVYRFIDTYGNSAMCSFDVTVCDDTPPTVVGCPEDRTAACGGDGCAAAVGWEEPTAFDNCDGPVLYATRSHAPGSSFELGKTPVVYEYVDQAGNAAECAFCVTVVDMAPPTISDCPSDLSVSCGGASCTAAVDWIEPTAWDDCDGTVTYVHRSHAPGSTFGTGATQVVYEFADAAGNVSTCVFDVTVVDRTAPIISGCPENRVASCGSPGCAAAVSWIEPSAVDEQDGPVPFSSRSHAPGSTFGVGTTQVVYEFTDRAGNVAACAFDVTVEDTAPPTISDCPSDRVVSCSSGECSAVVSWMEPTATDACDGSLTFSSRTHPPGSTFGLGTAHIVYEFTDTASNVAICSFIITVEDEAPPVIVGCPTDRTVCCTGSGSSGPVSWAEPMATDACDGPLTYSSRSHAPGSTFGLGTTAVSYEFRDSAGNTATCTFDITVEDTSPPDIHGCPEDLMVACGDGCSTIVNWTEPMATDNCGLQSFVRSHEPGDVFSLGTTRVSYQATDASGNVATCGFDVTVVDETPPSLACPSNISIRTANPDGVAVTFSALATDNCDPTPTVTCSPSSGSHFPIGLTPVICTACDESGNETPGCTFIVSVRESNHPPVANDDEAAMSFGQGSIRINVLSNDSDPDGDSLAIISVSSPSCGETWISGSSVYYGPQGCNLPPGSIVGFGYTISDGRGGTSSAMVEVTIEGGPRAPPLEP